MSTRAVRIPLFLAESLMVLPLGCVLAVLWANTLPDSYYRFSHALDFSVNDVAIALFFALMTKKILEATRTGGVLHPWRRAALPIAAAVGGIIVPLVLYVAFLKQADEPMLVQAWVVTSAIDVAACYLVGSMIFGRDPGLPFLLLLAIASDAIGLVILAIVHTTPGSYLLAGMVLVVLAVWLAIAMRRRGVESYWPYLLACGGLSWSGLFLCGMHPALALVPIVPFMPHAHHPSGLFEDPGPRARDTLSRFERWWAPPVQVILFLFGLVNAGVPLHGLEAGMWALPVATIVGRPFGVLLGAGAGISAGLHRTARVGWKELLVIGCAASIGLAFALFLATAILPLGPLLLQMKTGALVTAAGAIVTFVTAWLLRVGRFRVAETEEAHS